MKVARRRQNSACFGSRSEAIAHMQNSLVQIEIRRIGLAGKEYGV